MAARMPTGMLMAEAMPEIQKEVVEAVEGARAAKFPEEAEKQQKK